MSQVRSGSKPREIFRAHPLLGWTLTPGAVVHVPFRPGISQHVDEDGNRRTVGLQGPIDAADKLPRVHCYGCSFTYGTGLSDEETFCSLLQMQMPAWRLVNMGVGGHGTVHSLLRFMDDLRGEKVDCAVFGVISDHRFRNFPHPQRMAAHQSLDWHRIGVEHVPHAHLTRDGELDVRLTPAWQPSLERAEFEDFLPDDHMLDCVTIELCREIVRLGDSNQVPVVFALLDRLDPVFNRKLQNALPRVADVSVPLDVEHTFLPEDIHPNATASRAYARGLHDVLSVLLPA